MLNTVEDLRRADGWTSAKELILQLPKDQRSDWLRDRLDFLGIFTGVIGGLLLIPCLRVLHIHSTAAASVCLFAAIGAAVLLCRRLPRYIGESASIDLIGRIGCTLREHDLKPDGVFLSNGCECMRCGYRPSGRTLMKLRS